MPELVSMIQPATAVYNKNRASMLGYVDQLRALEQRAVDASSKRNATFEKRGQLPPIERLRHLLDPGMPFLRLHTLANYCVGDANRETSIPGASVLVGIGFVQGARCMIWVDDSGIAAGAATDRSVEITLSIQNLCMRQKLPLIHCVESAGANLLKYRVELWSQFGAVFRNLARMSAMGLPVISVLHGGATAGGAYMPGMSDYVIGVKDNGMAALGGAALVKAATGEEAHDRELGGTEMHASVSGLVEYLVENDAHALLTARELVRALDWNKRAHSVQRQAFQLPNL